MNTLSLNKPPMPETTTDVDETQPSATPFTIYLSLTPPSLNSPIFLFFIIPLIFIFLLLKISLLLPFKLTHPHTHLLRTS